MLNRIRSSWRKVVASLGLLTVTACGAPDAGGHAENSAALSATESCHTLAPDNIMNGGARLRTTSTYGRSTCFDGYLLDLNNYSPKYTEGTRVTYGGAAPTTQPACEATSVRAYVWRRNNDGSTTYLGQKSNNGVWLTDAPSGTPRCGMGSVLLERDIPGYAPGSSYRLALRAQTDLPYARKEIFIETQKPNIPLTPAQQLTSLAEIVQGMTRQAPGMVQGAVARSFGFKGGPGMVMECRVLQLELSAMRVMEPSFVRAGAAQATVSARTATLDSLYQGLCVRTDVSMPDLQTRFRDHVQSVLDIRTQIANSGSIPTDEAAEVLAGLWGYELRRIQAGCGTQMNEVLSFVESGAVPLGMTGPNVLLRNCGGSTSATQNSLGLGAGPASIASTLRACIVDAFGGPREPVKDTCSTDPRASGTAAPAQGQADEECKGTRFDGLCITKIMGKDDPEARDFLERTSKLQSVFFEAWHNVTLAEQRAAQLVQASEQKALEGAKLGIASAVVSLVAKVAGAMFDDPQIKENLDTLAKTINLGGNVVRHSATEDANEANRILRSEIPLLTAKKEKTREEMCKEDPNAPFCNPNDPQKRCAEWDLASGPVWFDAGFTQKPMTMADRIEQCTCQAVDAISGAISGGADLVCKTESEGRKHQCYGDIRSMPNPETCWDFFQPGEIDRDALRIDMCTKILCDSAKTPIVVNGVCTCLDTPPTSADLATRCNFNGPAGAITCDASSGLVCDALGARCVGFDAGRKPISVRGCRTPTGIQLGGRNEYGLVNSRDMYVATFPSRPALAGDDFFMLRRGFVSMSGPEQLPDGYASIGTMARVEVLAPDELPTGDRGSLQLLCSNPGANVFNRFCGQKEFTNLVPGANNLDFALDANCLSGCVLNGSTPYRFSYGFRTPTNQTQPSGLGGYEWRGTLTARANPFPVCSPTPDPSVPPDPLRLITLLRAGTVRTSPIEGLFVAPWSFSIESGTSSGLTPILIR